MDTTPTSKKQGAPRTTSRLTAAGRVTALYVLVQLISYALLQRSCSASRVGEVWAYGALGPLAAVEAIPRLQYHSWLSNAGFVLGALVVLAAPLTHVTWPRRLTLVASGIGLVVWCVYGLGFSIDHM